MDRRVGVRAIGRDRNRDGEVEDVCRRGDFGGERRQHFVGFSVDDGHIPRRDVGTSSVRRDCDPAGAADRHRRDDQIARRIDRLDDSGGAEDVDEITRGGHRDARRLVADVDRPDHRASGRVDHRHGVRARIGYIRARAVLAEGDVRGRRADGDGTNDGVGGRIDDRYDVGVGIRHVRMCLRLRARAADGK